MKKHAVEIIQSHLSVHNVERCTKTKIKLDDHIQRVKFLRKLCLTQCYLDRKFTIFQ